MVSQPVVSASIEIAAPAARIFDILAILADPRRYVEIDGSDMIRRCRDGPDRLGLGRSSSCRCAWRFPSPGSAQVYASRAGHVYQIVDWC